MDCLEARRSAAQGEDAEAQAHVDTCPVCSAMVAIAPPTLQSEAMAPHWAQLQGALQQEAHLLGRLRAQPRRLVGGVAMLVALALCAGVALALPRPDLAKAMQGPRIIWLFFAMSLLFQGARILGRSVFRPPLPLAAFWPWPAAFVAVLLMRWAPPVQLVSSFDTSFWLGSWRCFRFGLLLLLPLLAWSLVTRRGAGLAPLRMRVTLGAALGLVAVVALELHCPNPEMWHRFLGHGALVGLFAVSAGLRR